MDHIKQYDWCSSHPDHCFVTPEDLNNSATERILNNRFRDPMLTSDSEDERQQVTFNWDKIFKRNEQQHGRPSRLYVPGLRGAPPYPKLSALTAQQQYQCLKVICSRNLNIFEKEFIPKPTKKDIRMFEDLKEVYIKEQQEYKEWAKTLWATTHCSRALRPKPIIETVYEAEFKVRTHEMQSFPKTYKLAAQIPLEMLNNVCEMVYKKGLKKVITTNLPQSDFSFLTEKRVSIIRPSAVPEPCNKHPTRFILPNEQSVSMLPLTEVHKDLSQWASDAGASFVASESALKCLVDLERAWMVPVSVCKTLGPDGEGRNVVVLGGEFSINREPFMVRTYKAFRHLLEYALIPPSERRRLELKRLNKEQANKVGSKQAKTDRKRQNSGRMSFSSDDDDSLIIDIAKEPTPTPSSNKKTADKQPKNLDFTPETKKKNKTEKDKSADEIGFYSCTCKDTEFESPPQRSYKKWVVKNKTNNARHTIIVHCPHKMRDDTGEIVVEPIPEYQLELAGSYQSAGKVASLALSMALRRNASLLNVRVDGLTGDIVTVDNIFPEEFSLQHGDTSSLAANRLHSAINHLEGLLPGHYILQHEPSHGANAMLYAPAPPAAAQLRLDAAGEQPADADDAKSVKTPPVLAPVLLPFHKYRKILPLCFTPNENQVAREPKKRPQRQRTPPQAIRWPKKRQKKKKHY